MRPRIDLLTHPILFLALWLGLALSIAYSITPFNFSDPFTQSFPFFAESLAAVFFVLTWLLSLIHLRLNLKLNEQLAQQVQTHTLALKTLKSQHKNENSQIQTFMLTILDLLRIESALLASSIIA